MTGSKKRQASAGNETTPADHDDDTIWFAVCPATRGATFQPWPKDWRATKRAAEAKEQPKG